MFKMYAYKGFAGSGKSLKLIEEVKGIMHEQERVLVLTADRPSSDWMKRLQEVPGKPHVKYRIPLYLVVQNVKDFNRAVSTLFAYLYKEGKTPEVIVFDLNLKEENRSQINFIHDIGRMLNSPTIYYTIQTDDLNMELDVETFTYQTYLESKEGNRNG